MSSRREGSPPHRFFSSEESSYSDSSDGYPTRGREKRRTHSRHRNRHHRHHPYHKKTRRESDNHDENRSRQQQQQQQHYHSSSPSHPRRNQSRRTAIALRISSSSSSTDKSRSRSRSSDSSHNSSSKSRSTSISTASNDEREGWKRETKPLSDWVCGVCSNLNSSQRMSCYRCEAGYAQSRRARPSPVVWIRGVPTDRTARDLESALKDAFVRHQEALEGLIEVEKHRSAWRVRFPSVFESTKALIFCHCRLLLGDASCGMEFSKESNEAASTHRTWEQQQVSQDAGAPPKEIEPLPFELQPPNWKPPSIFGSIDERKHYLETLSAHWQYLSDSQKLYYDEEVKRVLLHPHASDQGEEHKQVEQTEVGNVEKSPVVASAEATTVNPIESLKRKLEEKKKELSRKAGGQQLPNAPSSSNEAPKALSTTDAVLQLKQRLAQKKAQIAADGRNLRSNGATPNVPDQPITHDKSDNGSNVKPRDGNGVEPSIAQPLRYIHGFPVPPLYNVEKALSNSTIAFHCIPKRDVLTMERSSRRVVWDEENLNANAEYQRLHPVTMPIDEPKTPYVHADDDVVDDELLEDPSDSTWDPISNSFVRKIKENIQNSTEGRPVAPVSRSGRPMLLPGTVTGELEKKNQELDFKLMRRAVYADEGAKFKAMLAHKCDDDDDDD